MSFGKPKEGEANDKPAALGTLGNTATRSEAYLGRGSKVVGQLTFTGPVELDGQIEGEINAQDRLTIGEGAVINAKVNGTEILIKGAVTGDVVASKRLTLKRPARIVGNISSTNLSIEEGVSFEGKCSMSSSSSGSSSIGSAALSSEAKSGPAKLFATAK